MPEQRERIDTATGGLGGPDTGGAGALTHDPGAGDVPVRTDEAVGASAQVRANAKARTPISDRTRAEARQIMTRYPRARSALLPMLHLVQSEHGYVTPEGVAMCAEELGLTKAEVGAVATFYTMYKRRPAGEYLVSVCTNTLCGFLGGEEIFAALKEHLGVEQDTGSALGLVRDLQAGGRPAPTRGAALCSFKEISRQLAGFYDEAIDQDAPSSGEPTLAGNRVALERGHESPAFDADTPVVPPPTPNSASEQAAPDPAPEGGQTAHRTSTDKAVDAADTPAEEAGAGLADPDTNRDKLSPGSQPHERATPPAPPTPAAAAAPATGAPTGPGSVAPPQARRTRTRGRSHGQAKIPTERTAPPQDQDGRS